MEGCADLIRMLVERDNISEERKIEEYIQGLRNNPLFSTYNFSEEQWIKVTRHVLELQGHHLDMGLMITAYDHKSWYQARIRDLPMEYTKRNLQYLKMDRGLNKEIVSVLDDTTSEILDGFGDPNEAAFQRRGLVMGDVQSGKTNTYVTISCKAADTGYKVIILLTGTLEALRKQTQMRMDEGFVGFDSDRLLKRKNDSQKLGVGKYPPNKHVVVYTSTSSDFKTAVATQINVPIQSTVDPILFVIKKNKNVLNNLNSWLKTINNNMEITDSALLLIDDEADNASVNTADRDNVTAINREIRELLGQFRKNTYVGFTATPYANIFIDPDAEKDLFPRDFIYCLRSPTNYVSPESVYSSDADVAVNANMVRIIEEGEDGLLEIPAKHKKDHVIPSIPKSLNEALNCFVLSCAIRDLRGDSKKHMSMLVNVSRFTNVQESMGILVKTRLFDMKQSIGSYSRLPVEKALNDKVISSLWDTWSREYGNCGFGWEEIQIELDRAIRSIVVRTVNSNNGAGSLDYKDNPEGLRLIAIGGNSLSRGLTLEGLCTSYFYRRSQSYDTLMQMGRWFGYRDGYTDLCRIWMTKDSKGWYSEVSQATEELKEQFEVMRGRKETPEEFGFIVKNDVNGLMITNRDKMRTASDEYITKSVNGRVISTDYIYTSPSANETNIGIIGDVISRIESEGKCVWYNEVMENNVWRGVQKEHIIEILKRFKAPNTNYKFNSDALINMINRGGDEFSSWDISIQHGNGSGDSPKWGSAREQKRIVRTGFTPISPDVLKLETLNAPRYFKEGIYDKNGNYGEKIIGQLENEFRTKKNEEKKQNVYSATTYLAAEGRRPILLIFPIELSNEKNPGDKKEIMEKVGDRTLVALTLGFPRVGTKDANAEKYMIKYKANVIYRRLEEIGDDLDEEVDGDE